MVRKWHGVVLSTVLIVSLCHEVHCSLTSQKQKAEKAMAAEETEVMNQVDAAMGSMSADQQSDLLSTQREAPVGFDLPNHMVIPTAQRIVNRTAHRIAQGIAKSMPVFILPDNPPPADVMTVGSAEHFLTAAAAKPQVGAEEGAAVAVAGVNTGPVGTLPTAEIGALAVGPVGTLPTAVTTGSAQPQLGVEEGAAVAVAEDAALDPQGNTTGDEDKDDDIEDQDKDAKKHKHKNHRHDKTKKKEKQDREIHDDGYTDARFDRVSVDRVSRSRYRGTQMWIGCLAVAILVVTLGGAMAYLNGYTADYLLKVCKINDAQTSAIKAKDRAQP